MKQEVMEKRNCSTTAEEIKRWTTVYPKKVNFCTHVLTKQYVYVMS